MAERYPFYAIKSQLHDFYAIELGDDDLENYGLSGWNRIGNKTTCTYKYVGKVEDFKLDLPCNADIVVSVHYMFNDFRNRDNVYPNDLTYMTYDHFAESKSYDHDPDYSSGKYAKYTQQGNTLHFYHTDFPVKVVYRGVLSDKDGLPELTRKEVEALASYCAWIHTRKQGMITKDKSTFEIALLLQQEWAKKCADARIPEYIGHNDMDAALDAATSWDRKRFGKSFKVYV
jgi:hypothetical protein